MDCYGLAVELDASAEEKEIIDLTRRLVSRMREGYGTWFVCLA